MMIKMTRLVLIGLLVVCALPVLAAEKEKESVYDRVMRTGTIRCAYANRPPVFLKSPETGQFEGIFYEYVEALGKALNLKIEWTMEVGWGDAIESLKTDKVDAFCGGLWPVSHRAQHIDFVRPILHEGMAAYTRADISSFDFKKESINSPEVTIVTVEGSAPFLVGEKDFPLAKKMTLPQLSPISDAFLSVATGKADVVLSELGSGNDFMMKNPGQIRRVEFGRPLRAFGLSLAVKIDEYPFRRMLDIGTEELFQTGEMEAIIRRHEKSEGIFYRVSDPYRDIK